MPYPYFPYAIPYPYFPYAIPYPHFPYYPSSNLLPPPPPYYPNVSEYIQPQRTPCLLTTISHSSGGKSYPNEVRKSQPTSILPDYPSSSDKEFRDKKMSGSVREVSGSGKTKRYFKYQNNHHHNFIYGILE